MSAAPPKARRRTAGQPRLFDPSRRRLGARPAPQASAAAVAEAPALAGVPGPGPAALTLERRLSSVWEGVATTGSAACPLCGAEMHREPGRAEGRCDGCGSTLG